MKRTKAFIGMGSNRGDRRKNLREAAARLRALPGTRLLQTASLYSSPAAGDPGDPAFLNTVAGIETSMTAEALLEELQRVEQELGRAVAGRSGPRTIDLDLLFYGEAVIDTPRLKVPHPRSQERPFVLVPMTELDPEWKDPRTGLRMDRLLNQHRPALASLRWEGPLSGGDDA